MDRKKSKEIYESSCKIIPGGVNSPVRSFPDLSILPLIAASGKGDTIWDADGNSFIDFCCSWGALILGHCHPQVVKACQEQIAIGSSFGIATESEEKLAKKVVFLIPSIEKIRFVSSGTEATMTALRVAKGYTNKSLIVKFDGNYHGHSDTLLVRAGSGVSHINSEASSKGVPADILKNTLSLPYNDVEGVRKVLRSLSDLAAVIVEPIAANMGLVPATREFLQMLREETQKKGAVLIFDEVISGFRVGLQGAQGLYQITPDLTCFGKIIGGGFPAAAFGGKKEIMDKLAPIGDVYQAGTLSGMPVAMVAGLTTIKELESESFYADLEEKTSAFLAPIEQALGDQGCVHKLGSLCTIFLGPKKVSNLEDLKALDHAQFKKFFSHMFERGIYIPPSPYEAWFISSAHTEQNLKKAQNAILEFLTLSRSSTQSHQSTTAYNH